MIARRLPIVALLVALAAAAFVVDARHSEPAASSDAVTAAALSPLATATDSGTSTWFCAGGTAAVTGAAEQTVTLANPTDAAAAGTLELFLEGQEPQRFPVEVAAHDERRVTLSTLAQGEWAAALVELDHGGVIVTHEVQGVGGWDADRCSSQASDTWYLPWGQTAPQEASSLRLALFNPFAVEAVVDISFDTDDGFRAPEALQGFLVPPRRLVTVDVTNIVPVRQRISTSVVARSGRLVVDGVESLSGVDGSVTLDVTPAAPEPATSWYFADGRVDADTLERIAIFNPTDQTADLEVEVARTRVTAELAIEPFSLQVGPQSYAEVVLNDEGRVPKPLRHSTIVRSLNDVGVVAERVQLSSTVRQASATAAEQAAQAATLSTTTTAPADGATAPADGAAAAAGATTTVPTPGDGAGDAASAGLVPLPPGLSASLGSPVVSTAWVLPNAGRPDVAAAKAVIANVSATQPVTLQVELYVGGVLQASPLPEASATLERRQQVEVPLTGAADAPPSLMVVRATGPVVVDGVQTYGPLPDTSFHPAVPLPDGVRVPDALNPDVGVGEPVALPNAVSTSTPPAVTAATTAVPTTAPTTVATSAVPVTETTVLPDPNATVPAADPAATTAVPAPAETTAPSA